MINKVSTMSTSYNGDSSIVDRYLLESETPEISTNLKNKYYEGMKKFNEKQYKEAMPYFDKAICWYTLKKNEKNLIKSHCAKISCLKGLLLNAKTPKDKFDIKETMLDEHNEIVSIVTNSSALSQEEKNKESSLHLTEATKIQKEIRQLNTAAIKIQALYRSNQELFWRNIKETSCVVSNKLLRK